MQKYKILLFVIACTQLISNFLTNFSGGSNFNELLITPAGYTFAIWGLIILLCLAHSAQHLFVDKKHFSKKFYLSLSAVYILFTVWLLAAERELILSTVIINFAMFFLLQPVFKEVQQKSYQETKLGKLFLEGGVGVYVGWLTIASVANLGVLFASLGMDNYSQFGQVVQALLVLLASVSAGYMLSKFKFSKVLFATYWWAFVGILVGLLGREGTSNLIVVTILCVVVLNIFYLKWRKVGF
jgi:hypothetical protein